MKDIILKLFTPAILKSASRHILSVMLTVYAMWVDNPALGLPAIILAVVVPLAQRWVDTDPTTFGRTKTD